MPNPKKRTTRSRRDMRRAHDFLVPLTTIHCNNCNALVKPHHICASCGHYKGQEVVAAKE